MATALPAPYEDVAQTEVHYVPYDSFGTFYKIHQLGTIKDAFTFLIPNTVDDYMPTTSTDASPFVSRNRGMVKSTTSLLDPGLSSSPSANLSDGAYGSELEGDSSDTDTEPKETRPKGIAGKLSGLDDFRVWSRRKIFLTKLISCCSKPAVLYLDNVPERRRSFFKH